MVEDDVSDERASVGRRLIIGGARSGKTAHALALAKSLADARGVNVTYVATAQALDQEMQHRISLHRAERPATWRTLEAPAGLAQALRGQDASSILVIDCMTLWLSNALLKDFREDAPTAELAAGPMAPMALRLCSARRVKTPRAPANSCAPKAGPPTTSTPG